MKPGDLVICVLPYPSIFYLGVQTKEIKENDILTIRNINNDGLIFEEFSTFSPIHNMELGYEAIAFRKLDIPTNYIEEKIKECLTRELVFINN
jgi:hypothetical protein